LWQKKCARNRGKTTKHFEVLEREIAESGGPRAERKKGILSNYRLHKDKRESQMEKNRAHRISAIYPVYDMLMIKPEREVKPKKSL